MLPLVNEEQYDNYSRYLRVETLDEAALRDAARIFDRYSREGIIRGSRFEDGTWRLTDEVKNYLFDFRCDGRAFRGGAGLWCGTDCRTFERCMKAYALYTFGQVTLGGIQEMIKTLRDLAASGPEEAGTHTPGPRVLEFLASLPGACIERDRVMEAMEENRLSRAWKGKESRRLSDFRTYLRFDRALSDFWASADRMLKKKYFPVYFWWKLTAILPLRPTEFLLIPCDCLRRNKEDWILSVRRTRNKKASGKRAYRVNADYGICEYTIPWDLAGEVLEYQMTVEAERKPVNRALLLPGELSSSWYMTYPQLHARLDCLIVKELKDASLSVNPGDTRHLAMINLILSGGSPTVCRELAGHEDFDISSNYYANLSAVVESSVYEFCHSGRNETGLDGRMYFPAALPEKRMKVDSGWCACASAIEGSVKECLRNYRGIGRLGECMDCVHFYPSSQGMRVRIREDRKQAVDLAGEFLMQMVESVRRGNGSEESILSAMARLQKAGNDYAGFLYRRHREGL